MCYKFWENGKTLKGELRITLAQFLNESSLNADFLEHFVEDLHWRSQVRKGKLEVDKTEWNKCITLRWSGSTREDDFPTPGQSVKNLFSHAYSGVRCDGRPLLKASSHEERVRSGRNRVEKVENYHRKWLDTWRRFPNTRAVRKVTIFTRWFSNSDSWQTYIVGQRSWRKSQKCMRAIETSV